VADIYEKNTSQWHHHCHIVKKGDREHSDLIDHLQLIFIELPKFPVHSSEEKKLQVLWLRFLREINEKTTTIANELLAVPEIAKAIQLTQEAAFTPDELTLYESYWDQVSREKTLILDKYLEGMVAGKAEGFKEAETKVQQYLVKRLIKLKKTDEEIREITELSFQELMEIKQQIGISSARKEHKIKLLE
jgi:predicted transposase/invertase (TIGR01784 family)